MLNHIQSEVFATTPSHYPHTTKMVYGDYIVVGTCLMLPWLGVVLGSGHPFRLKVIKIARELERAQAKILLLKGSHDHL